MVKKTTDIREFRNPFEVIAADTLDLRSEVGVEGIRSIFMPHYTDLATIRKRFNTILEGQRGTGKTMIMKYLALETQISEWENEARRAPKEFFSLEGNFIGIYTKLRQGIFDRQDLEAIDNKALKTRIFEHLLVLHILGDFLNTLALIFSKYDPPEAARIKVLGFVRNLLRIDSGNTSSSDFEDMITELSNQINTNLILGVDMALVDFSPGSLKLAPSFKPWLTIDGGFAPFLRAVKDTLGFENPFYLMLDDFDVLRPYQQACVFKSAAAREFRYICFKFGIMVMGRKVSVTSSGRTFRQGDDYDLVNLDWTSGGLHKDYKKAVEEIAVARLEAAGWQPDLSTYFPGWAKEGEIRQIARAELEAEWRKDKEAGRFKGSVSDYFAKYENARYFQIMAQRKNEPVYAGKDYILLVSSGIFRQYLEICKLIFDTAFEKGWRPDAGGIKPEIQNDVIYRYSEDMMDSITITSGDTEGLLDGDIEITSKRMVTLVESLCNLFSARLHLKGHREPEIFCVAIRDDLDEKKNEEAKLLLNVAVRESILHRFRYPPKTRGGPPLPTFMLNRRLGPRRKLSILKMQGRIEIPAGDIVKAASDRDYLVTPYAKKESTAGLFENGDTKTQLDGTDE